MPAVKNPYSHMNLARQYEEKSNNRAAENEWRGAVKAADKLPMDEYEKAFTAELAHYKADKSYEAHPGVTETALRHSFSEVLALPFITRIELAGFYARHGAYSEALDACEHAFSNLPNPEFLRDPRVAALLRRAEVMKQTLTDEVGPEEMERLFEENFSRLDADGNGYIHHSELERAQFDLSLSPQCQSLIRHLLSHYFDVEAAHSDEWGIDIKGIATRHESLRSTPQL
jgi:hypothetical protein